MTSHDRPRTLVEHANLIATAARTLSEWCAANGHPEPSLFPADSGNELPVVPTSAPMEIRSLRQDVVDAAKRIQQIATEPTQFIPEQMAILQHLGSFNWLLRFNIPNLVPAQGTITYAELAKVAAVPCDVLKSVLRMSITNHVFCEPTPEHVRHTRVSAYFARSKDMYPAASHLVSVQVPVSCAFADATAKWSDSKSPRETAFCLVQKTDKSLFDYMETDASPAMREDFVAFMTSMGATYWSSIQHLVDGYNWAEVGNARVVDVGGSSGHGCIALAQSFPDLHFIVQDLAKVVEKGENELRKRDDVSDQVKSRIRFKPFNFFESQPESDADIYLMRQILHDWPDEEAKTILRNLRPAMKPTAKLLIMETVLPQPGVLGLSQETIMRSRDMLMHEMLNAHERELDEWARLLEEVDADWQIKQVRQPFGSNVAVIEVVFR